MKKNSKNAEKIVLTPRNSRKLHIKKKTFVHIIPKDNNIIPDLESEDNLPKLSEIITILKKTKQERTFSDINKLNTFLTTKFAYFRNLRNSNDAYKYSWTLSVIKYIHIEQGKNIVTFDEEGDRCYILLEGEVSILKPQYVTKQLTIKEYVNYLQKCDKKDPSKITRERIIEKNNHINIDVVELLDNPIELLDDQEKYNIFIEYFEKVFEAKEGFTFGETALLHKQKRNATVRAEKDCKLIYIDKLDYNRIMKESEKKRKDDEIYSFVEKFYLFNRWGYINLYKFYSLMTDIKIYKNDYLYKQNDESEYIYFCIEGKCEKYSYISLNWKKEFIDYISDFSSNILMRLNANRSLNYLKLTKLITEAKNKVPTSPMVFRNFDYGKFNLSFIQEKNINELIENKDEHFSDPFDLIKIKINNVSDKDIIGLEEVSEFKKRFCTIQVKSDYAHFKRIKAIDFFKLYINNTSYERNDDLILNYIGGNKRILVKQIELLFNYKKNKHHNQYIEEYNKLYNNINIEQRKSNDKMEHFINSLSKAKKKFKDRNMFLRKISKFQMPKDINNLYKSNDEENDKADCNDSIKFKSNYKISFNHKYKLAPSKIYLYRRNFSNLTHKFKLESPKSKLSSFTPSTKNQTNKLKDDSGILNNNFSGSFSSNMSCTNFIKLKKNKKSFGSFNDKSIIENYNSNKNIKLGNNHIKVNNLLSFDLDEYKKNLYCKYGFFINEIIKLGIGPNIRLRKKMTKLKNDVNMDNRINFEDFVFSKNKQLTDLNKEIRKKRYEFLKITEL
jgi:CRP-like cAMP-binding protein